MTKSGCHERARCKVHFPHRHSACADHLAANRTLIQTDIDSASSCLENVALRCGNSNSDFACPQMGEKTDLSYSPKATDKRVVGDRTQRQHAQLGSSGNEWPRGDANVAKRLSHKPGFSGTKISKNAEVAAANPYPCGIRDKPHGKRCTTGIGATPQHGRFSVVIFLGVGHNLGAESSAGESFLPVNARSKPHPPGFPLAPTG